MTAPTDCPQPLPTRSSALRWTAIAFVYWLTFMAMLEPGNLLDSLDAGARIDLGREAVRLLGAAALGAAVTPLLLVMAARWPVSGPAWLRNGLAQVLGVVCLAPCLIVVSCLLAAWLLAGEAAPSLAEVRAQLLANSLLLVVCLGLFVALIQVAGRLAAARPDRTGGERPSTITVRDRGRLTVVDLGAVDWIETQGNYQALHVGAATHLLRETSEGLARRLDPGRFVRIHRRAIVAVDRVRRMEPLANGDAVVHLSTGAALRLSRRHRAALRNRMEGGALMAP